MDESINTYRKKKAKCDEAIQAILRFMSANVMTIPSIYQRSRVNEDLPATPEKEAEIQRRLKYLEPENRQHIETKANDLLTYAQVARMLNSEIIAIIVLSKLRTWEESLRNPERGWPKLPTPSPTQKKYLKEKQIDERTKLTVQKGIDKSKEARLRAETKNKYPADLGPPLQVQDAATKAAIREKTQKTIEHYKTYGQIKKILYDFTENQRNLKGPKLPNHALPPHYASNGAQSGGLDTQRRMDMLKRQMREAFKVHLPVSQPLPSFPPPLSPDKIRNIQERNKMYKAQFEELGKNRIAAAEKIPEFGDDARKTTLPRQTIPSPHSVIQTDKRVDIDMLTRDEIERYKRLGFVKKTLYDDPDYQRDVRGHKLPDHALPPAQSALTQNSKQELLKKMENTTLQLLRDLDEVPPQSLLPPQTPKTSREDRLRIRERNERLWTQTKDKGQKSRTAGENIQPPKFGDTARKITLPKQTIPLASSGEEPRVDIEEQRRRDMEEYKRKGAIKKRLYSRTDYASDYAPSSTARTETEQDLRGYMLPDFVDPSAISNAGESDETQRRNNEHEEEQNFIRELQLALEQRPQLSLPPPPLPRRNNVKVRNDALKSKFEEQGQRRQEAVKSSQLKFGEDARTTTLPKQTIPPAASASRLDIDIQRRARDIKLFAKLGAIKKGLYDLPNYDRDLKGARLPDHGLITSSSCDSSQPVTRKFKILDQQTQLDNLRRALRSAMKDKEEQDTVQNERDDQNDRNDDDDVGDV